MSEVVDLEVLVTVKAQPVVGPRVGEVVCVAGVLTTPPHRWVRLFPVRFRRLRPEKQFAKYDVIRARCRRPIGDRRAESWVPDEDSIEVVRSVSSKDRWRERMRFLSGSLQESMCGIQRDQAASGTSLGAFRPSAITGFDWEADEPWEETKRRLAAELAQPDLFDPRTLDPMEQVPLRFRYGYRCADSECRGHSQTIIDWEIGAAFRKWREAYGEAETLERLKAKWLEQIAGDRRDPVLFVGNLKKHPLTFLLLGVAWPPRGSQVHDAEPTLFS